jgi:hypothetical protein
LGQFANAIQAYVLKTKENSKKVFQDTARDVFGRIVDRTPVDVDDTPHKGQTKANWRVDTKEPDNSILSDKDIDGSKTKSREDSKFDNADDVIFIYNNEGHISALEYGLYPKPGGPKTDNGFSTQAPSGMVRITLAEFKNILDANVLKNKR